MCERNGESNANNHYSCVTLLPLLVAIVTRCAKRLPIGAIPKQPVITTVRLDVINGGRRCAAHTAFRVPFEIVSTGRAPSTIVATPGSTRTLGIVALVPGTGALNLAGASFTVRHYLAACADMRWFWHYVAIPSRNTDISFSAISPVRSKSGSRPSSMFCLRCSGVCRRSASSASP